ncbi:MAG: hypothetical protein NUV63_06370 [Gallionella sp.]|nr:hypothetical protein [Gallionella sp.]
MKKNDTRFLTAIFCDDIRQEIGGKLSFMGCYQGELIVPMAPVALPKLCLYATIWTPKDRPFKSLMLRVVQDDDKELARLEIPEVGLAEVSLILDETATRKTVSTAIVFSPFAIEKPTSLRLMATTEEGEIIGPRLLIKVVAAQEPAAQPAVKSKPAKSRAAK